MKIITPNQKMLIQTSDFPVYLVGSVFGDGAWEERFIKHFLTNSVTRWTPACYENMFPVLTFVVSCEWGEGHSFAPYFAKSNNVVASTKQPHDLRELLRRNRTEARYLFHILNSEGLIALRLFPDESSLANLQGAVPCYESEMVSKLINWVGSESYYNKNRVLVGLHPEFPRAQSIVTAIRPKDHTKWQESHCKSVASPEAFADWVADNLTKRYQYLTSTGNDSFFGELQVRQIA